MIYDRWMKSWNEADVKAYKALHHDEWEFCGTLIDLSLSFLFSKRDIQYAPL